LKTPVMSTYLVAVVVGEFEASSGTTTSGGRDVAVRCLTPVGKTEQGKFAAETSCKALDFYSKVVSKFCRQSSIHKNTHIFSVL